MNLAQLCSEPRSVYVNGQEVRVSVGTAREVGKLDAWLRRNPPPRAGTRLADLPPTASAAVFAAVAKGEAEAGKDWPPEAGSPDWLQAILGTEDGSAMLLRLALEKSHPEVDDAAARSLAGSMPFVAVQSIGAIFMGWMEPDDLPKGRAVSGQAPPVPPTGETSAAS